VNGPGTYLLAMAAPLGSDSPAPQNVNGTFQQIVGRAPVSGESVQTLNGQTQVLTTTTFNGTTWDNGTPHLAIGQSAYFVLSTVPEPSTYALFGLGAGVLFCVRRFAPRGLRS